MGHNVKNKRSMNLENEILQLCFDVLEKEITPLEAQKEILRLLDVSGSLRFSEHEIDFAYLCGVFNVSGIDGLHNEIQRLKELGKKPHDIIEACRNQ